MFPVSHLFRHISTFPQVPAVFYSLFALMIFPVWAALGQARQPGLRCRPGPDPHFCWVPGCSTHKSSYSLLQALDGLRDGIFQGWCLSVASTSCWICYQPLHLSETPAWLVSSSDSFLHKSKVFWPYFQEVQNTPPAFHFPSSIWRRKKDHSRVSTLIALSSGIKTILTKPCQGTGSRQAVVCCALYLSYNHPITFTKQASKLRTHIPFVSLAAQSLNNPGDLQEPWYLPYSL